MVLGFLAFANMDIKRMEPTTNRNMLMYLKFIAYSGGGTNGGINGVTSSGDGDGGPPLGDPLWIGVQSKIASASLLCSHVSVKIMFVLSKVQLSPS